MENSMFELDEFLKIAQIEFGLRDEDNAAIHGSFYVDVPCRLSENRLVYRRKSNDGDEPTLTNPLIFLTGIRKPGVTTYTGQSVAKASSISIVVGQYGLGKTELLHQICGYVTGAQNDADSLKPLPISLAACQEELSILSTIPSKERFSTLLFSHILKKTSAAEDFVLDTVLPRIIQGNILLILDGLDELILNSSQHRNFFSGLTKFLEESKKNAQNSHFRVVVSTRLEYLLALDSAEASELVSVAKNVGRGGVAAPIYFLTLDLFDDSRIKNYLENVIHAGEELLQKVQVNPQLVDILRRPLLLKIFCELVSGKA
jgi:hypothetical protein